MPLLIEAIFSNTVEDIFANRKTHPRDYWAMVSGVTPGSIIFGGFRHDNAFYTNYNVVTAPSAFAIGSSTSRALVAVIADKSSGGDNSGNNWLSTSTAGLVVTDKTSNETTVVSGPLFVTTVASNWTITQDATGNCNITCTSIGSGGKTPYLLNLNRNSDTNNQTQTSPTVFSIELLSPTGSSVFNHDVAIPLDGSLPFIQVPSAAITTTGTYATLIKTRYFKPLVDGGNPAPQNVVYKYQVIPTALTAPSSAIGTMYSWLTNDYYYLTDLQVNLDTRAVTHRHGTVTLRPNDTVNFAILFNNGTSGVDPIATDIRIAIRGSSNNGPYALWSAATVTTVAVNADTYYSITMTAIDEELLSIQAKNILAGTANESLIGEIQWTTSKGTYSSNTFTINVPTEVVREPDV
ncbi:MAG: hypothetical protein EBT82_04835 [Micrococcales bacterium]|nr:hypothetical protein [Micrococcales bacterium]NBR55271.1 hypothetical protein [Micrococcales bacterium]